MNKFAQRSRASELIDEPGIPFEHWATCLRELNIVNTWLGGHAITVSGIKNLLPFCNGSPLTVAEIGCGGGDNLKAIYRFLRKQKIPCRFIGVDINRACTDFAVKNCSELPDARFVCSDYREMTFDTQPHIIFNSLFCHHFSDDDLVHLLRWMQQNSTAGFFINDLQRHPVAFHSIKLLTGLLSRSYLVKNDAPISVARGFIKKDWQSLMAQAGIKKFSIRWCWAFRYLVTAVNGH